MSQGLRFRTTWRAILIGVLILSTFALGLWLGGVLRFSGVGQVINQQLVRNPAYRWFILETSEVVHSKEAPVPCPSAYKAVALFGQSNASNIVPRKNGPLSIGDGKTFMWDWTTGLCHPYLEPLAGTSYTAGNIISSAISKYRAIDSVTNLIVIAFGHGGSSIFSWSHGIDSIRLDSVIERLKISRISPDLFLLHQGESDARDEIYLPERIRAYGAGMGSRTTYYMKALRVVLEKLHSEFPRAHIGIAIASICRNEGSEDIRAAQQAIQREFSWVSISSNTDRYGDSYRYDKCHFNEKGEQQISDDYLVLMKNVLASPTTGIHPRRP